MIFRGFFGRWGRSEIWLLQMAILRVTYFSEPKVQETCTLPPLFCAFLDVPKLDLSKHADSLGLSNSGMCLEAQTLTLRPMENQLLYSDLK